MEEANKEIVLNFLRTMEAPPAGILADDFELTVTGRGPRGCTRDASEIAALQNAAYQAGAGEFIITPINVVCQGNMVVVEAKGHLPLKTGGSYDNEYSFHFEVIDGQIARLRTYCDTAYAERLFPGV